MALMFDEGRGRIVTDIVPWLTQSDEDLTAAGALAVGNCARNGKIFKNVCPFCRI